MRHSTPVDHFVRWGITRLEWYYTLWRYQATPDILRHVHHIAYHHLGRYRGHNVAREHQDPYGKYDQADHQRRRDHRCVSLAFISFRSPR